MWVFVRVTLKQRGTSESAMHVKVARRVGMSDPLLWQQMRNMPLCSHHCVCWFATRTVCTDTHNMWVSCWLVCDNKTTIYHIVLSTPTPSHPSFSGIEAHVNALVPAIRYLDTNAIIAIPEGLFDKTTFLDTL